MTEVVSAIQAQNTVNPAGQVGGSPSPKGQEYTYSVRAQGRLTSPEEFGDIVVRELPDGGIVRVRDVARIELGAQDYTLSGRINGKPGAIIAVYQLARQQRRGRGQGRPQADGGSEEALSAGRRLRRLAGHDGIRHGRHARHRR